MVGVPIGNCRAAISSVASITFVLRHELPVWGATGVKEADEVVGTIHETRFAPEEQGRSC
jgi:hypothetical protein